MSWDSYIDNLIGHTVEQCDKACIIGLDGGAKWTTDGHQKSLKLSDSECAAIAKCFKAHDFTGFQSSGVWAENVKYQFLREEDGKTVFAKKKDNGALSMQCSKTAVVIAHTKEGGQQGNTNKGVAVIADYLESIGM